MSRPELYIFAISHFCEKARWALDFHGIEYRLRHIAPGVHVSFAKKHGAPRTSVPILLADGQTIQGSAAIVDWADAHSAISETLTPADYADESRSIEKRLDDVTAVHIRRYYYSEALCDYPERVKPVFTDSLGVREKIILAASWNIVRKRMIRFMDLGSEQFGESREIVLSELDWLDGLLGDGRQYILGGRVTRADVAAASLLSPLAAPAEHPVYSDSLYSPRVKKDVEAWAHRPTIDWVRKMYAEHRLRTSP